MFDLHSYLRREFKRYYPDALVHVTTTNDGETIDVGVVLPHDHTAINYRMAVGSDDEYFEFTSNVSGRIVTVPFAPEMGA